MFTILRKGGAVMWDKLFQSADLLQKGLEASWTRNTVIRNNIANVETPGFKGSDVRFESLLAEALETPDGFVGKKTRSKHIDIGEKTGLDAMSVTPRVVLNDNTAMRMDGNNVDIEAENVKLAQNSLLYNTELTKLNSELTRIKLAVSEGK
jgi:flagellar basal-body rod protein FlgB